MNSETKPDAEAIARSRPPDKVSWTPEEPVYGDERTRLVAADVRGVVFRHVQEYTEIVDRPIVGYTRNRIETWTEKARQVPRIDDDGNVTVETIPPQTVARKTREDRGPGDSWSDVDREQRQSIE